MKKLMITFAVLAAALTGGLFVDGRATAAASSGCDDYAIMRCGANSPSDFINKARSGRADLRAIYSDFGLVPAEYSKFAQTAKHGTLYDDGRIVVNGTVVGRSTMNLGRVQDANFNQRVTIGGNSYWGGPFGSTYHANTADVMVMFNDRGVMQFAVVSSCGNPQRITPVKPNYSCQNLRRTAVAGKANTYTFTTNARATQGAELVRAVYDFGDGDTRTVTNLDQPVQHTFTKSSKVRVTVYVKLPGGNIVTATGVDCVREITVKQTPPPTPPTPPAPTMSCTRLDVTPLDSTRRTYRFTAIASHSKDVQFTGANFDFGDGVTMQNVLPNGDQAIIEHSYAKAGTYNITATLNFSDGTSNVGSANCGATVTPTDVIQYCKPGIPVGSKECEEQLIATGPSAVIGVVGGAGLLAGVGHYVIRRRFLS